MTFLRGWDRWVQEPNYLSLSSGCIAELGLLFQSPPFPHGDFFSFQGSPCPPLQSSFCWRGWGWDGAQGVGEEVCQCTLLGNNFLNEKFIGLFLGRVKMFPYQNSHFKTATSRCSWHQNDCVKAVCQQIVYYKTACIKMAVSYIGTGLAIKGMLFRMSVLFIKVRWKVVFLSIDAPTFSRELDLTTRKWKTKRHHSLFLVINASCKKELGTN